MKIMHSIWLLSFGCTIFCADDYAQIVHGTMWADFLTYDKQHVSAQRWYQDVIAASSLPHPLRSYSLLLFGMEQYGSLLEYQPQLQLYFSDDVEIQKAIAFALLHEKRMAEAEEIFLKLAHKFPTLYEVVIPAAQTLIRRGDAVQAQELLEKILNTRTSRAMTPLAMILLAQLYLKAQNIDAAHALLMQCTTAQPMYAPAWLLIGTVEELRNNHTAALNAYRTFTALSPIAVPQIEKRIHALTMTACGATMMASQASTPTQQALGYVVQKKYDAALPLLKMALHAQQSDPYLRALYIHSLVATSMHEAAIAQLASYIGEDPHDHRWWGALHLLVLQPSIGERAWATLHLMRLTYPVALWGYFYEADCMLRTQQYQDAHALYAQALMITQSDPIRAELYFMQALCGYELRDYALVATAVEAGLSCGVLHAPLCNIAAYYYAHSGNYGKAEELIQQCCALEPRNHHYRDTAAYIAYKKGDIKQAKEISAVLCAACPTDATIYLHHAQIMDQEHDAVQVQQLLAQAQNHAYSHYEQRRIQAHLRSGRK